MHSNRLRLLYDISVLGMGTRDKTSRTGVFRVIENLFEGFKKHDEIELTLFTHNQFKDASLEYLAIRDLVVNQGGLASPGRSSFSRIFHRLFNSNREIEKDGQSDSFTLVSGDVVETDIFHSPWFPVPEKYLSLKKPRPFITIHDLIPVLFPQYFTEGNLTQFKKNLNSINKDTWIICNSESTKNDLLNYYTNLDPDKVSVTYWAASSLFKQVKDQEVIKKAKQKYKIPEGPYFLSLATIEPRKNIGAAIKAFYDLVLQEKIKDLNLVLVGTKGWKYQDLLDLIGSNPELESRIIFTGYVDDEDLSGIYSGALAFVYPSFYEGFGLPLLEAMQCGAPVICSNASSLPEVIGDAGILINPNKIDSLSSAFFNLYTDSELRMNLSQKSLTQCKKFSWETTINNTIDCYKKSQNEKN